MEWSYFRQDPMLLVPCASRVVFDLERLYRIRIPKDRITVVHNGFDPKTFSPEHRKAFREQARNRFEYSPDDIVLVMIANEWQRKGLKVLLDAMALVRPSPFRLLLVGRKAPTSFAVQIKSLRLGDRVRYVGAVDDVALYHSAADVFVLPTQYEAFALAIVEALASGLPVITTNVPGASDLITPGMNGLLLDNPEDCRALAGLLQQAMDVATRTRWSENAPLSVIGLDWKSLMTIFETAILDAMEKPILDL
jgi:UDP-glucose:(heptosyl)LPS alpha-1,3-glucosyltransferase